MSEKKETAIRRLHLALNRRFKGQAINMTWAEMDAFMMKAQTWEMTNIMDSYNEGYTDCKAGLPNRSQIETDESTTNV